MLSRAYEIVSALFLPRHLVILSMISSSTGCQMNIAKNATNAVVNSTHFGEGITAEYVVKSSAVAAAAKKYLAKLWDSVVFSISSVVKVPLESIC